MTAAATGGTADFHEGAGRGGCRDTDFQADGLAFSEKFFRMKEKTTGGAEQKPTIDENQLPRTR
ncbi:hypothetical protein [Shinella sp.]|uniref:hypothetical protein n=1 Tax=Shinella sp. TaxID=1870904 RepID=UPI002587E28E|nr:hypothetical protein [Shinella sp.]MCW5711110.1 hypothetical protein [Shinella sp.]